MYKLNFLFLVVSLLIVNSNAHANSPQFSDIVRYSDGSIAYMYPSEARRYCANNNSHLPTIREFAQLAISLGATGMKETAYPNTPFADSLVQTEVREMFNNGYYYVLALNQNNESIVDFYFNELGYHRPAGDFGKEIFISTTSHPLFNHSYAFMGDRGGVNYRATNMAEKAVVCVEGL